MQSVTLQLHDKLCVEILENQIHCRLWNKVAFLHNKGISYKGGAIMSNPSWMLDEKQISKYVTWAYEDHNPGHQLEAAIKV